MNQAQAYAHQLQELLDNRDLDFTKKDYRGKIYIVKLWNVGQYLNRIYLIRNFLGNRTKIGYFDVWSKKFKVTNYKDIDLQTVRVLTNLKLGDMQNKNMQKFLDDFG